MKKRIPVEMLLMVRERLDSVCRSYPDVEKRVPLLLDSSLVMRDLEEHDAAACGLYHAVVLGTDNLSKLDILSEGESSGLFKVNLKSIVSLVRSPYKKEVVIEFIDDKKKISEEVNTRIEQSFLRRGKRFKLQSGTAKIPSLIIA